MERKEVRWRRSLRLISESEKPWSVRNRRRSKGREERVATKIAHCVREITEPKGSSR